MAFRFHADDLGGVSKEFSRKGLPGIFLESSKDIY